MRIGVFTDSWEPSIDGVVSSLKTFKRELEALGHEVHTFAPNYAKKVVDGPRVYRFRSMPYPLYPEYNLVAPIGINFSLRRVKELKLDIVHSHSPFGVGSMGLYVAWRHKLPCVHTYHTLNEHYLHYAPGPRRFWVWANKAITRGVLNRFDHVLAPSMPIKDILLSYGVRKPIEVLPSGLDLSSMKASGENLRQAWGIAKDAPFWLTVSRLGEEKNIGLILESFAIFAKGRPDARLVFLGNGPGRLDYEAVARKLGLAGQILFKGMQPHQVVLDALSQASLFVFASISETQGLALLEALAMGLPSVIVPAMGTSEVMEKERGGLFCENNPESMAAAATRLIEDKALWFEKAEEGKVRAAEYAAPLMASRLAKRFEQLIEEKQR